MGDVKQKVWKKIAIINEEEGGSENNKELKECTEKFVTLINEAGREYETTYKLYVDISDDFQRHREQNDVTEVVQNPLGENSKDQEESLTNADEEQRPDGVVVNDNEFSPRATSTPRASQSEQEGSNEIEGVASNEGSNAQKYKEIEEVNEKIGEVIESYEKIITKLEVLKSEILIQEKDNEIIGEEFDQTKKLIEKQSQLIKSYDVRAREIINNIDTEQTVDDEFESKNEGFLSLIDESNEKYKTINELCEEISTSIQNLRESANRQDGVLNTEEERRGLEISEENNTVSRRDLQGSLRNDDEQEVSNKVPEPAVYVEKYEQEVINETPETKFVHEDRYDQEYKIIDELNGRVERFIETYKGYVVELESLKNKVSNNEGDTDALNTELDNIMDSVNRCRSEIEKVNDQTTEKFNDISELKNDDELKIRDERFFKEYN